MPHHSKLRATTLRLALLVFIAGWLALVQPAQASIEQINGGDIIFKVGSSSTTLVPVAQFNASGMIVSGSITQTAQTTGASAVEMGQARTGDGPAYVDLHGDATYSDYGLRMIRFGGANAVSGIYHRGTGALIFMTQDAGNIQFFTSSANRMWINPSGLVAINNGGSAPTTALDVTGAIYSRTNNAGAATSIDWSLANAQYTSASCGAFTFSNMQDGGVYTLAVQGTTSGTCSFTHTGLTFKYPTDHGATTASTQTLYSFQRMGTVVYVSWIRGY